MIDLPELPFSRAAIELCLNMISSYIFLTMTISRYTGPLTKVFSWTLFCVAVFMVGWKFSICLSLWGVL